MHTSEGQTGSDVITPVYTQAAHSSAQADFTHYDESL